MSTYFENRINCNVFIDLRGKTVTFITQSFEEPKYVYDMRGNRGVGTGKRGDQARGTDKCVIHEEAGEKCDYILCSRQ